MAIVDTMTIPFGQADIEITGPNDEVLNFDGKDELQQEGAELTITPQLEDVTIADYGTSPFDKRVVGYEMSLVIRAARQTHRVIKTAMTAVDEIVDAEGGDTKALADAPIGTSLRERGVKVKIKPRNLSDDAAKTEFQEITIFKMIADGDFSRTFGNEQGNIEINYSVLPKDDMDPSKPGNFFAFGDASALETPAG